MDEPRVTGSSGRVPGLAAAALLAVAIAAAFGNALPNAFQLDDTYGLVQNEWIRGLRNIPRYFVDPFTLTTHRSNADYRPILQITYALNYAISGYQPWSWHVANLVLHWIVAYNVFALGRTLWGSERIRTGLALSERQGDLVSLAAATLFAVHPLASGCVNYLWARSSLLVAAYLVPAMVLYLRAMTRPDIGRQWVGAYLLYLLALFTKAEAVSFLGIIVLAEWLLLPCVHPNTRRSALLGGSLRRAWPFVVLTLAYLGLRQLLIPQFVVDARHAADMTPYAYFLTQLRAWWYYVGMFFAPVRMVADESAYPISRSIGDPRVIWALAGWLIVAAILLFNTRTKPAIAFLGFSFFVYLAPHSSISPLAEMVNEHRPYLPSIGLFLIAALALFHLISSLTLPIIAWPLIMVLAVPYGWLSRQRNLVWRDDLTLWSDVVAHSPLSSRGQMNYGVALMARGRMAEAEARFRETVRLAPRYHFARSNLGIVLALRGDMAGSRREHDMAVQIAPNEEAPYFFRGDFRMKRGDLAGAADDFRTAIRNAAPPARRDRDALNACLARMNRSSTRPAGR